MVLELLPFGLRDRQPFKRSLTSVYDLDLQDTCSNQQLILLTHG
jgi:hypothetical protein